MSNFFPFISGLPHHSRPILGLLVSVPQNQFIYSLVICLPIEKNADYPAGIRIQLLRWEKNTRDWIFCGSVVENFEEKSDNTCTS